jgi:hypothetical protein
MRSEVVVMCHRGNDTKQIRLQGNKLKIARHHSDACVASKQEPQSAPCVRLERIRAGQV